MQADSQIIRCHLKRTVQWVHLGAGSFVCLGLCILLGFVCLDDLPVEIFLVLLGFFAFGFYKWNQRLCAWVELDGRVVRVKRFLTRQVVEFHPEDLRQVDSPYPMTMRLLTRKGCPRVVLVFLELENTEAFLDALVDRSNRNRFVSRLYQPSMN